MANETLNVAVVTGRHPFDVPGFYDLLCGLPGITCYPQPMEDFVADFGGVREWYDALVFYNYHQTLPDGAEDGPERGMRGVLERLGESEQGIVLLHHALVAFPRWRLWSDLCGIADRAFTAHVGQAIHVEPANPDHPITRGLSAWEMVDETYAMNSAGADSDVLLAVDHPKSTETTAWTRRYRRARVFCYQSGHDRRAYADPNFQTVLARGVQWVAGRL